MEEIDYVGVTELLYADVPIRRTTGPVSKVRRTGWEILFLHTFTNASGCTALLSHLDPTSQ
jgi:hypothetical protein